MTIAEPADTGADDVVREIEGVTETFRPRVAAAVAAWATDAKAFVTGSAADETIDIRIGVREDGRGADTARDVADALLDRFPAATRIDVQVARIS